MSKLSNPIAYELISILDKLNDGIAQMTCLLKFNTSEEWSHFSVDFLNESLDAMKAITKHIDGKIAFINNFTGRDKKKEVEDV